jgi:hypothetical protein
MATVLRPKHLIILLFGLLPFSNAQAQESQLCSFVKRVLAERPGEFAKFKGALTQSVQSETTFHGTVAPDSTSKCLLNVRRQYSPKEILEPTYSCTRFDLSSEAAKALYVRYMKELGPCLSGTTVTEEFPKPDGETLTWKWKARTADYLVELEATNGIYMMTALVNRKPLTDLKMTVTVTIRDLSPPRPGAVIPTLR